MNTEIKEKVWRRVRYPNINVEGQRWLHFNGYLNAYIREYDDGRIEVIKKLQSKELPQSCDSIEDAKLLCHIYG